MKKFLSLLLAVVLICTTFSVPAWAATNSLNWKEKAIAKAYITSYEQSNSTGLKKYMYSNETLITENGFDDKDVKIFGTAMTKKYDSKTKMNYIQVTGTVAASSLTEIKFYKVTFKLDLKKKKNTTCLFSASIVNLKEVDKESLSNYTSAKVREYLIKTYGEPVTFVLLDAIITDSDGESNPAQIGSTFVYETSYDYGRYKVAGTFALTLNEVKDSTYEVAQKCGYKEPDNEYREYKEANITWTVLNAEVVSGNGNVFKDGILIYPFARRTIYPSENGYLGYMLDNGLAVNVKAKIDALAVAGQTTKTSYQVSGNIVFPVAKDWDYLLQFWARGAADRGLYYKVK